MKITLTTGQTITAEQGQSLLKALQANEIYLVASCGGKGSCGKCKVRVLTGEHELRGTGKLGDADRKAGLTLACMTYPLQGDLTLEIPQTSLLTVGDKIALSHAADLQAMLAGLGAEIDTLVKTVELTLPVPTISDNISDLDRMRRALDEQGIGAVRFSHGFAASMAEVLRGHQWKVQLGYLEQACAHEAVFFSAHDDLNRYGIAVDIGTTTVVVYLVDLRDGRLMDSGSTYNSQMRFGDDVITRIVHTSDEGAGEHGLGQLKRAVLGDINNIVSALCMRHGIDALDIESASISGNTTMAHLFWGLTPGYIREEPYIPTLNAFPLWHAGTAGLAINPQAPVYTMPCVASYVGGDIVSGVMASGLHRKEELALFMDIGTNGEVAIGNNEWIVTAACSAGPCFEGSGIRHGMRATAGAIEAIKIDPVTFEPALRIIGEGTKPVGICGSGMIDAISELYLTGAIDQRGAFATDKGIKRIREGSDGMEYVFYEDDTTTVSLTGPDIDNLLRAKAAIYAGVSLLLKEVGLTMDAVERVYIAGGFGNYLNVERSVTLGMLPDLPPERYKFIGNSSVTGAYLGLLSGKLRAEAESVASMMTYLELSVTPGYMDEYMSAMFLPHTDATRFPTVMARMKK
jgi:uncharacterized 2Fe-2S/4Fe-4S cluster protein (DUF4445 family)